MSSLLSVAFSGGYEILRLIAQDAHAVAFLAKQNGLDRTVVLKAYRDPDWARRERDAWLATESVRAAAALLDFFTAPGAAVQRAAGRLAPGVRFPAQTPIAALAWVDGESPVASRPPDHPLAPGQSWRIEETNAVESWRWAWDHAERLTFFRRLVDVVAACHHRGRVHGDLRPANVVYAPQWRQLAVTAYATAPEGAPGWRSPWHGRAAAVPEAADVYALLLWALRLFPQDASQWSLCLMLDACGQDPHAIDIIDLMVWEPDGP